MYFTYIKDRLYPIHIQNNNLLHKLKNSILYTILRKQYFTMYFPLNLYLDLFFPEFETFLKSHKKLNIYYE